jgi:hypothetical protein
LETVVRHDGRCEVTCLANNKTVEAEIIDFKEKKSLNLVINKSVKLNMVWNGKLYEGRGAGLDFESHGPRLTKTLTNTRIK